MAIDLKDYTIDHNKNIIRFIMLTEDEIKELNFEEGLKKLEELVTQLDDGNLTLEESISYYEIGVKLKSHCEKLLKMAELKVCLLYTSPSPRDVEESRMPSSA